MIEVQWREVVALAEEMGEAKQPPEQLEAELAAAALLFEAFLKSGVAQAAARMYERFNDDFIIVQLDGAEERRSDFYDIFGVRGLIRRERKFGNMYADDVAARTPREVVADWVAKYPKRRAFEFLPWLFEQFGRFADRKKAELNKLAAEKTAELDRQNK